MSKGNRGEPRIELSDDDQAILGRLDDKPFAEALRQWIAGCQAVVANSGLQLPSALPLCDTIIRSMIFTPRAPASGRFRSDFDVFEAGRDSRPVICRGNDIHQADRAIQDRIIMVLELLRAGRIGGNSFNGSVPSEVWGRSDAVLLTENSDLVIGDRLFHSVTIVPAPPETSAARSRRGRRPSYDWENVVRILVGIANSPDGLPDTKAEIIRRIQEAYAEAREGQAPSDSQLKERLNFWLPDNWPGRTR